MMKLMALIICMIISLESWVMVSFLTLLCLMSMVFTFSHSCSFPMLSMSVYWDKVSSSLVILTLWVVCLCIFSSVSLFKLGLFSKMYLFMMVLLLSSLILSFSFSNMILFYISFEFSLYPMLIMILGWGYQPERTQAGMYMFLYTVFASLPLLMAILYMSKTCMSVNFMTQSEISGSMFSKLMLTVFIFVGFFVKLPVYMVHLWLPKAHVEAPVSGSMVLAGVLLKLGGYGLIRCLPVFQGWVCVSSWFSCSVGLVGGLYVSVLSLRQSDMKSLIAYTSVAHMSFVLSGLLMMSFWGLKGCMLLMVGHGLCSSGLFFLANLNYSRSKSRSMFLNKGVLSLAPSLTIFWFMMSIGNMAVPPTLNFFSEVSVIISAYKFSLVCLLYILGMCFFSAAYSLYLYVTVNHGVPGNLVEKFFMVKVQDFFVLMSHLLPLNLLFLSCYIF